MFVKQLASLNYYYFACKITELADTIIFVLRKKQNQVTFLHVYHHFIMVWNSWAFLKYEPGYWMVFLGAVNSFVHTIMYAYYGLSAYPSLHKYLWWKKYITSLQLVRCFKKSFIVFRILVYLYCDKRYAHTICGTLTLSHPKVILWSSRPGSSIFTFLLF